MWNRAFDAARRTMTLEQAGWNIVYEAKPHDTDTSQAALFHGSNRVAAGVCNADYTVDGPQPAPTVEASAPAPACNPPTPAPASGDDVPFIQIRGMMVIAIVGGHSLPMVVDTGAAMSSIPTALADRLIAEGHAQEAASGHMVMADGSSHDERTVIVDTLWLGSHSRSQVRVSVSDGEALLGLPVLNAIGRFTIDAQRGVVSFT
jgi:gag-polyprotein putative aspartyl protease